MLADALQWGGGTKQYRDPFLFYHIWLHRARKFEGDVAITLTLRFFLVSSASSLFLLSCSFRIILRALKSVRVSFWAFFSLLPTFSFTLAKSAFLAFLALALFVMLKLQASNNTDVNTQSPHRVLLTNYTCCSRRLSTTPIRIVANAWIPSSTFGFPIIFFSSLFDFL